LAEAKTRPHYLLYSTYLVTCKELTEVNRNLLYRWSPSCDVIANIGSAKWAGMDCSYCYTSRM